MLFFPVMFVVSLVLSRKNPERVLRWLPDIESLRKAVRSWNDLWSHFRPVLKIMTIQLASVLIQVGRLSFLFLILFGDPFIFYSIFFTLLGNLSGVISLTPGGLGIREGIVALSSVLLGYPVGDAVLVTLVDRAVGMLVVFPLGLFSNYQLNRRSTA